MRQLEALGLAVHVAHRGSRVKELDVDDLRDTFEARIALEPVAVARATGRITAEEVERAQVALDDYAAFRAGDDKPAARAAHDAFHFTLYNASGSQWLVRLIRPAWDNSERYRELALQSPDIALERQREHERILAACAGGDAAGAARELRRHLTLTANLVADQLGSSEIFPAASG